MKDLIAEIFAVGEWNGIDVTQEMLIEIANNFARLNDIIDVPLKFGHNDEQPMVTDKDPLLDGKAAMGWVERVWVDGQKLFAKFTDMPEIVYTAIKKKLYKNVSIEAIFEVKHKGVQYGTVLTAVALLGVDMPAVNTLKDLTTYMTANNLAFSSHATFSKKPTTEESTMTPEEQAEMARLKLEAEANNKLLVAAATDKAKFTADAVTAAAELKTIKDAGVAAEFARDKKSVEADLETLVKENKITPATRDKLAKDFTTDTAASVKFTVETLKENTPAKKQDQQGRHKDKTGNNTELPADEQVMIAARKFSAENKVSFSAGVQHILAVEPELAREYANLHDGGE